MQQIPQQRSISPMQRASNTNTKLVLFSDLDAPPNQSQKSFRVKDATTLFDLTNYLQQFHQDCEIQLFANNERIWENLNFYAINILHKYQISIFHYKAISRKQRKPLESCIVKQEDDDEGPGLDKKLRENQFTPSLEAKHYARQQGYQKQSYYSQESSNRNQLPLTKSQPISKNGIPETPPNQSMQQSQKSNLYDSNSTVQEIKCSNCNMIYNSFKLRKLITSAMEKDEFAKCEKCKQNIKREMYKQLAQTFKDYENFRNVKNYKNLYRNITEYGLKDNKLRVAFCQNCGFICFWQQELPTVQIGYCPQCLSQSVSNPFSV